MNKKAVAWLLIVIVMVTSVMGNVDMTYANITNEVFSEDNTKIIEKDSQMETEKVFEGDSYRIKFNLSSCWETGYIVNVKVENIGNDTIHSWYLSFEYDDEIINIWNAELVSYKDKLCVVKNAGWNQDIPIGESIEFGYSVNSAYIGLPENCILTGTSREVETKDYFIKYNLDSDWGSGFVSNIQIINNTDITLEDWVFEFDFEREITGIWNGVIEEHDGNHYIVRNAQYNSNLVSGQCISIGISGGEGDATNEPVNYKLYSYSTYDGKSMEIDTDNDGLVDGIETLFGLNYRAKDSDNDGLSDYFEFVLCNLNPLCVDSDGNGVSDGDEDSDGDGLINKFEYFYNTNPMVFDSDKDGLNDCEETAIYFTDPLCVDTDGDGLSDYDDVKLGFSPLKKDTNDDGIWDCDVKVNQTFEYKIIDSEKKEVSKVSIELSTKGNIENTTSISNMYDIDRLSSDVVGLIGVPVEINSSSEFEKATITFWYDKEEIGDTNEEDLAIMWYDMDNHCYRLLDEESVVNTELGNVSYETTHFSTYMLVNKNKWYDAWKENLDYRTSDSGSNAFYEFAFVVDVSGSMKGDRISLAKRALNGFAKQLNQNDEACLVKFNTTATIVSDFTNDKNDLMDAIIDLDANGGTDVNAGLLKALALYEKQGQTDKKRVIVLLCDGDVNYKETTINKFIEKGIMIYSVNVGAKNSDAYLKTMSEKTGGEYYYCESTSSIETALGFIQSATIEDIDTTDTDGDGLYDVYETVGVRLINGRMIRTNPQLADTDGDGLSDYEEVGIIYSSELTIGSLLSMKVRYALMYSDPCSKDTDRDTKIDSADEKPWTYDTVNNLIIHQSKKLKGKDEYGYPAEDLEYGDKSRDEICSIGYLFNTQLDDVDSEYLGPEMLYYGFEFMATFLFARGDMEDVILDMINHAKDGTGSDYSNEILTKNVYNSKQTKDFVDSIKGELVRRLINNGGNIYELESTSKNIENGTCISDWVQKNVDSLYFKSIGDIFNGLTICVDTVWGYTIEVSDYNLDGTHFSGTLHFKLYDNFGLDRNDVSGTYGLLSGFRDWYVLQHYDRIKGVYVPFVSLMEFDVPFEGNVLTIREAK